ncbi:hypothetical protein ACNPQN_43100, partial [Streptomyces sp. NPDC056297]|uniref:hypothetical protein n=1 Tax=Streptomyces sp. NPDC056297 TaxID=3345776 RepID=UPI003AB026BF
RRHHTVTARITTPTEPPAPDTWTATVYINTHDDNFDGHQPHHPLAAATHPDGSPLRLIFHTSDSVHSHETAAHAVFDVGNRQRPDDNGQTWPTDIRFVSTGDVIKVTGPDHWIVHLSVDPTGFSAVPEPTTLVNLAGTRATSRR